MSFRQSEGICRYTCVKKEYDNWMHVIEYDGKALLYFKQSNKTSTLPDKTQSVSPSYPALHDQQVSQSQMSITIPAVQPSLDAELASGDSISAVYNGNQVTWCPPPSQHVTNDITIQYDDTSFILQNQLIDSNQTQLSRNDSTSLALAPPQHHTSDFHPIGQLIQPSNNGNSYDDNFLSEVEIQMRSCEMLENEDMQHLLRVYSMGGGNNIQEDGYGFPSYIPSPCPNFNFDEDRNRSSGKAAVGWLKIKAAMRWDIFVRKKAAERRAQLTELED